MGRRATGCRLQAGRLQAAGDCRRHGCGGLIPTRKNPVRRRRAWCSATTTLSPSPRDFRGQGARRRRAPSRSRLRHRAGRERVGGTTRRVASGEGRHTEEAVTDEEVRMPSHASFGDSTLPGECTTTVAGAVAYRQCGPTYQRVSHRGDGARARVLRACGNSALQCRGDAQTSRVGLLVVLSDPLWIGSTVRDAAGATAARCRPPDGTAGRALGSHGGRQGLDGTQPGRRRRAFLLLRRQRGQLPPLRAALHLGLGRSVPVATLGQGLAPALQRGVAPARSPLRRHSAGLRRSRPRRLRRDQGGRPVDVRRAARRRARA